MDALYGGSFYGLTRRASSSKWYSSLIENLWIYGVENGFYPGDFCHRKRQPPIRSIDEGWNLCHVLSIESTIYWSSMLVRVNVLSTGINVNGKSLKMIKG